MADASHGRRVAGVDLTGVEQRFEGPRREFVIFGEACLQIAVARDLDYVRIGNRRCGQDECVGAFEYLHGIPFSLYGDGQRMDESRLVLLRGERMQGDCHRVGDDLACGDHRTAFEFVVGVRKQCVGGVVLFVVLVEGLLVHVYGEFQIPAQRFRDAGRDRVDAAVVGNDERDRFGRSDRFVQEESAGARYVVVFEFGVVAGHESRHDRCDGR